MTREVVEAVRVLETRSNLVVIASNERRGRERPYAIDDGIRVRTVTDKIPEYERVIVTAGCVQHGVKRLDVGVNVAEDEIFQNPIHSRMRSAISGTGRDASMRTWAWAYAACRRA